MQGPVLEVEEAEVDTLTVLVAAVHEMIEGIMYTYIARTKRGLEDLTDT